jgi:hypothetical protein
VVIRLDDVYYSDLTSLSSEDKAAYDNSRVPATYAYDQYKKDVVWALADRFGSAVEVGDKAIAVAENGSRRKADVPRVVHFALVQIAGTSENGVIALTSRRPERT